MFNKKFVGLFICRRYKIYRDLKDRGIILHKPKDIVKFVERLYFRIFFCLKFLLKYLFYFFGPKGFPIITFVSGAITIILTIIEECWNFVPWTLKTKLGDEHDRRGDKMFGNNGAIYPRNIY